MEEIFFCPSCMAKTRPADSKCPVCGCDVNIENAPHQLPVNTILYGRYIVGRVLGAGGFGITYIGYDLKLDGRVAIKEYYPSGEANRSVSLTVYPTAEGNGSTFEMGKERFLKEARVLSGFVEESSIVTLRDYFEENGTAYIVMEYLDGEDLSHYAARHGKFTFDEALDLLEPAMHALDKLHKEGLIHRDISPSNIMVLNDGRIKVLDFGAARLQSINGELSLSVMLKPGYAPIEQYSTHGEQGPWTDVYAMSATVYRLITGRTPPSATDRTCGSAVELPSALGVKITPAQEKALMRGLALQTVDRTQTMAELAESLRARKSVHGLKPEKPKAPEKRDKPGKPALPKKRLIAIGAAALVVLAVCLTLPIQAGIKADKNTAKVQAVLETPAKTESTAKAEPTPEQKPGTGDKKPEDMKPEPAQLALSIDNALLNGTTLSAGISHTVGLKSDGTVIAVGSNYGECDVSDWRDIIAVDTGFSCTFGLKADGTVVVTGSDSDGQCKVSDWTDIVAISSGMWHTVGLRADGTVIAVGSNNSGVCEVSDWADIVAVSAGTEFTAGLKNDGTVVVTGQYFDVSGWTDIAAIGAGSSFLAGLKYDGTVLVEAPWFDVSDWTDIVAISAGAYHLVGLRSDGKVVAVGYNESGACEVSDWADIVAVGAGCDYTVGLRHDGTVIATEYTGEYDYGQCDVSDWGDIRLPGADIGIVAAGTL